MEPFLLSKPPVSQDLYFEITNENPSIVKVDLLPVETVTFNEAVFSCDNRQEQRPVKGWFTQWPVMRLVEHATSHQILCCIDIFVLRKSATVPRLGRCRLF